MPSQLNRHVWLPDDLEESCARDAEQQPYPVLRPRKDLPCLHYQVDSDKKEQAPEKLHDTNLKVDGSRGTALRYESRTRDVDHRASEEQYETESR